MVAQFIGGDLPIRQEQEGSRKKEKENVGSVIDEIEVKEKISFIFWAKE